MSDALARYLHDHLTGSHFALNLLDSLIDRHPDELLGRLAISLKAEIQADQNVLTAISETVGKSGVDLSDATAWLAEKASRLKLRQDEGKAGLGTFETLETLLIGIQGKSLLWRALSAIRKVNSLVPDHDYVALIGRAEDQYARVEAERLNIAAVTFRAEERAAG